MKKYLITVITIGTMTSSLFVPVAFAQTVTPTVTGTRAQRLQERQDTRITDLKTRADNEITRRITSLQTLTTKLGNMKHLTATQVSSFTTEVNTEISNLTALKAKIDADTDLTTLRTDVQSIIKSYRVYALFLPQVNILAAADRALYVVDMFNALYTKLSQRIQQAQAAGNNVTTLTATLADMQTNITNAQTTAQQIITTVTPLTPDGYPGNRTTLQSARSMFKQVYTYFVAARKDAKTIIQTLRTMKMSGTPEPSQTPEPTK
ncbi:MAG: hypothetical protein KGL95_13615 [Patescibacteria group bacterium]|nr:hypothetical protein [Patescibacteria group bacterium]